MSARTTRPSRNQVRIAAKLLRKWWIAPDAADAVTSEVGLAWGVVRDYRSSFQRPLDKVTIQLRRFVGYETSEVVVAQRLKRMPTILNKLSRQPTMDITRMQDIGGCRAVMPSADVVQAVLARIGRHWGFERVYDYVEHPKESGYRAVHVSVLRSDRLIEIQLRTPWQQQWAAAVERAGARMGVSVKDGQGPDEILRYFRLLGSAIALEESGQSADDEVVAALETLQEQVRRLMDRNG
ncbi:MAG: RelA/SpoT domain-containing protein [Gaiellaceae bacterium]